MASRAVRFITRLRRVDAEQCLKRLNKTSEPVKFNIDWMAGRGRVYQTKSNRDFSPRLTPGLLCQWIDAFRDGYEEGRTRGEREERERWAGELGSKNGR